MKRFILLLSMCLLFICATSVFSVSAADDGGTGVAAAVERVYEDATTGTATVYNDAKDIIKTVYPEVKDAIVAIGRGIGVAAEHVYEVLVRKYFVEGVAGLLWLLLGIAIGLFGFLRLNKSITREETISWRTAVNALYIVIGVIVCCQVDFNHTLMGLINPEWGAINYILEYTRGVIN